MAEPRTLRLAHRGDHRLYPENSLAALLAAMDIPGCDGLEFDVRAAADGVPVIVHDHTLERVHGHVGAVADLTADDLEGHGVARLDLVLASVPRRAFLDVEIKESFGRELVEVLAAGRGPDLHGAVVSSFDVDAIARLRGLVPAWPTWLAAHDLGASTIGLAVELGCVGVSVEAPAIGPRNVAAARAVGLEVAAWTVTRRSAFRRLAGLGLAAICVEGEALTG